MPLDPSGRRGPTRWQVARSGWRRTSHGLFVPTWVDETVPEQRILEQSMRLSEGAVTGWASLRMHGGNFFDGLSRDGITPLPVPLSCTPLRQIRSLPGDDLIRDILVPEETVWLHGVPCTVPHRATFDAVRYAPNLREAVVALDMAAAAAITSVRRLATYVGTRQAWQGVQQARDAVVLASELSRSPQESRLRLLWQLDADRPRPLVNVPVFEGGSGRLLGYPDLLDPEVGLVGEYDGDDHRSPERHSHDVDREARFREHGLEVVRVTGPDLRRPGQLVDRILAGYRRARSLPRARTWTLDAPAWWGRPPTLDEVLDDRDQAQAG